MRKAVLAVIAAFCFAAAGTAPAAAGGVFDNSSDWGHFIAGMIVQEVREDAKNERRIEEERQHRDEIRRQEEQRARERERARYNERDRDRDREDRGWYEISRGPDTGPMPARGNGRSKMKMLLDVHEQIMDEVLEESRDSREFILEIHDDNGRDLYLTAQDIRPFVYEYFAIFRGEQGKMYDLWVETKFEKWLTERQ